MATVPSPETFRTNDYPTASKKPMPETDWHRNLMYLLIDVLGTFFAGRRVYVSGNLLVFYQPGNRRRHVSPDVFVARGVEPYDRPNYLVWEARGPEVVIELTSSTTRREDLTSKRELYQNTLRVREYYLFDPHGDYLDPPLQGYRLRQGTYRSIRAVQSRLPSQVLGLHLERDGQTLRLWNPATGAWLPTPDETLRQAELRAEQETLRADLEALRAEQAETEIERLRRELEAMRRRLEEQG